jgi:hypothetical protein
VANTPCQQPTPTAPTGCRSWHGEMRPIARAYLKVWYNYLEENVNDTECDEAGRLKPDGLSVGYHASVFHDWGGDSSVQDYKAALALGAVAGDIFTGGDGLACSVGVDCSGYGSQVWGIGNHGTCTLFNVTCAIEWEDLAAGDILARCQYHAMLVWSRVGDHFWVYESTTDYAFQGVVYSEYDRYYLEDESHYEPRRYEGSCAECP